MDLSRIDRTRRRIGMAMAAAALLAAGWLVAPAVAWRAGPWAAEADVARGAELFSHEWRPGDELAAGDGLGPVYNARSCAECHFQGGVGGGGPVANNVITFHVRPAAGRPEPLGGLIHKYAVPGVMAEDVPFARQLFPVQVTEREVSYVYDCGPGTRRVVKQVVRSSFDPLDLGSVNTPALFGAGWVDRIPAKAIVQHGFAAAMAQVGAELQGDFSGIAPGRVRFLKGGRVGRFGWKAQFASLEEFVAAACANELGLGTAAAAQAAPLGRPQPAGVRPDLDAGQFRALVAFVDTLPRPVEAPPAGNAAHGKRLFARIGCALCHTEDLGQVRGLYSDLLLHAVEDDRPGRGASGYGGEPSDDPDQRGPAANEWRTPPLWGVADSAPYFHDGGSATLEDAIRRHAGSARPVTKAFRDLPDEDRKALVEFLRTLRAPPPPAANPDPPLLMVF